METSLSLYIQTRHYSSSASSPPPSTNLRRFHHLQNVRRRPYLTMPLSDLAIRRITINRNKFRFNQATESFSIAERCASFNQRTMSEERKKEDSPPLSVSKISEVKEKEGSSDKSNPADPPPPPPEKPLPGDCCGSGCVRCVWDVYYEELEEYNNLLKADSKNS